MSRFLFSAAVVAAAALSAPASATVSLVVDGVDGTFTALEPRSTGVYGVELRGGRPGARDWEVGVGNQTSNAGTFNQGEFNWASGQVHNFSLTWLPGSLSFSIGGLTVTDSGAGKGAPLIGNTLRISMVGVTGIGIDMIDGTVINNVWAAPNDLLFSSSDSWGGNGFTMNGLLSIQNDGGSRNAIRFSVGDFRANGVIPEPASWALMIAGFGLVGAAARRRRPLVATA